jgi:predicted DCC family thiol-disulfide oxidoreductase YuxK
MPNSHFQDRIIFFDGYCILCNRTVDFLIKHDRKKLLKFASLQSATAENLIQNQHNLHGLETVVFYNQGKIYNKSDAALKIAEYLGFPYNILKLGYLVPLPFRNSIYDYIARNRFRWFGKRNSCRMPDEKTKDRLISIPANIPNP